MENSGLEARVLLCDASGKLKQGALPSILEKRFPPVGSSPRVELTFVDTFDRVHNILWEQQKQQTPQYSLLVYAADQLDKSGSVQFVKAVRRRNPLLAQMMVSEREKELLANIACYAQTYNRYNQTYHRYNLELSVDDLSADDISTDPITTVVKLLAKGVQAGITFYVATTDQMRSTITGKIYKEPTPLPNAVVVKLGGSALDRDYAVPSRNIDHVCKTLSGIHQQRKPCVPVGDDDGIARLIVMIGAGPDGDRAKVRRDRRTDNDAVQDDHPKKMLGILAENLREIRPYFDFSCLSGYGKPRLHFPREYYEVTPDSAAERIHLLVTAPPWIVARDGIPLEDSDTQLLAAAEFYGAQRVVFIKRTDGVYAFDPRRGYAENPFNRSVCSHPRYWKKVQQQNKRHPVVTVDELLAGSIISREGTDERRGIPDGSQGHIIEDSALHYFKDHCKHVREILVVNIAPQELYVEHPQGRYHHIVASNDVINAQGANAWQGILEQSIRAAVLNGNAKSKIVKSKK